MPVTAPVFCSTMTDDLLVFVALFFFFCVCYHCANGWLDFKSRLFSCCTLGTINTVILFCFYSNS